MFDNYRLTDHARLAVVRTVLLIMIVGYGAALRLIAITETFGPVTSPALLAVTQRWTAAHVWRPEGLRFEPAGLYPHRDGPPTRYQSDPYTYLQYAREMRNFYAAHRREPLFPFATRVSLRVLSNQDVAVSFASAAFSVLVIWATFELGAAAFGFWVGIGAGLLVAVEKDLIAWGVGGWRDDAFMAGVLLVSIAALRFSRSPSRTAALMLGITAGAACLVRITSLSFIAPVFLMLLATRDGVRERARRLATAAMVAAILVAPFLVNCWRVYGDPFYAINVHATVYQEAEGRPGDPSLTVGGFLGRQFRSRPVRTVDTVVQGLTVYPFANKWSGFHAWNPAAPSWLAALAVIGLVLCTASFGGRLLLVVLLSSLVPYAATWRLIADWRFTEHAYPFFLIAASFAVVAPMHAVSLLRRPRRIDARTLRSATVWVAGSAIVVVTGWYVTTRILPRAVMKEALRSGEPATILALDRDDAFFGREWQAGPRQGIPTRVTETPRASLDLALPTGAAYDLLLRVDVVSKEEGDISTGNRLDLLVNGRLVARCDPGTTQGRVGLCRVRLQPDVVRAGRNRLTLMADPARGRGFRVWYLVVEPTAGG
jgi:hypothetical protein